MGRNEADSSKSGLTTESVATKPVTEARRKRLNEYGVPVLLIDTWSSTCGYCGRGADPEDKKHSEVLSMSEAERSSPGCGIVWEFVSSNYVGSTVDNWCKEMRPDLTYIPTLELLKKAAERVS